MLCPRCRVSAEEDELFCRHCGLDFGPKGLNPEQRGKLKLCPGCMVCLDIEKVLGGPPDLEEQGGWFQILALDDSCESCRRVENTKFSREHLAELLPSGQRPVVPECWCGLVYIYPSNGRLVSAPKRNVRNLTDLRRNSDGTYDLRGLSKNELADLIWEEATEEEER